MNCKTVPKRQEPGAAGRSRIHRSSSSRQEQDNFFLPCVLLLLLFFLPCVLLLPRIC